MKVLNYSPPQNAATIDPLSIYKDFTYDGGILGWGADNKIVLCNFYSTKEEEAYGKSRTALVTFTSNINGKEVFSWGVSYNNDQLSAAFNAFNAAGYLFDSVWCKANDYYMQFSLITAALRHICDYHKIDVQILSA